MKIGLLLLLLAIGFAIVGILIGWVPITCLLLWTAYSFAGVGFAYLLHVPEALGKVDEGTRKAWAYPLAAPFLVVIRGVRGIMRLAGEDAFNEVSEGIYVGRIVSMIGLPEDTKVVVDMTSEFIEEPEIRERYQYFCLPTLDGTAPNKSKLVRLLKGLETCQGPIYVHCAAGHARSALVAGLLMIRRGDASDIDDAERLMQVSRPGVRLAGEQKRLANELLDRL